MHPDAYARFTRPHTRVLRQLVLDLEFFVADINLLGVFSVESRVKTFNSAIAKAERIQIPIDQLQDIGGLRIVVATKNDVMVLMEFFRRRADISKDLKILKEEPVARASGYRSTHLTAEFSGHYSRSVFPGKLEIQIPTIFEHAFNFVSHSLAYKSPLSHDKAWLGWFREVSDALLAVDELAASLQRDAYGGGTVDASRAPLSVPLYQRVVRQEFGEEVSTSDAVHSVAWFTDRGADTVAKLEAFFRDDEVMRLWQEFSDYEALSRRKLALTTSKVTFWMLFGTNVSLARELLAKVRSGE
ncbi:MAG: hypothetical protein CMP07_04015 [Xanthomonadales bacterium]|nr:hypothetical protein [Xanthomonadales bacterium]|tara:strand:+ start:1427 stop:2326 length:900 start_codon:yes stop_codon:yes gene_type:complete